MRKNFIIVIIFLFTCTELFSKSKCLSNNELYLITDKTLYLPGETIWFSGYFIDTDENTTSLAPDILSVALLRQDTTAYTLQKNYLVSSGFCSGSLTLPYNILPGTYELVAAPNILDGKGKPVFQFRKLITIESNLIPPFHLSFQLDTLSVADSLRIAVHVYQNRLGSIAAKTAYISYYLSGDKPQKKTLNAQGQTSIIIPKSAISKLRSVLYTNTTVDENNRKFTLKLPIKKVNSTGSMTTPSKFDHRNQGIKLEISRPITNDTLVATITVTKPITLTLAFQSQHSLTVQMSRSVTIEAEKRIVFPLHQFPKGMYKFVLLNETRDVVAARQFFAHYRERNKVSVNTAKDNYTSREKVTAIFSITDSGGKPSSGVFTIKCINTSRVESNPNQSMPAYYDQIAREYDDRYKLAPLESRLGKRLLNIGDNLNNYFSGRSKDTIIKADVKGKVFYATNGRSVNEAVSLLIKQDSKIILTGTDSSGNFYPLANQLAVEEGKGLSIKVGRNGKFSSGISYAINMSNPMRKPMEQLQEVTLSDGLPFLPRQSDEKLLVKEKYEGNILQDITVVGKRIKQKTDNVYGNNCGDFVGPCGILNCLVHGGDHRNTLPVAGRTYDYRPDFNTPFRKVVYQGCVENSLAVINKGRVFNGMAEILEQNANGTYYLSTLYWKPIVSVTGSTEIEFATSDLPGTYKIILEGIAQNGDVVYQEKVIIVEEAK